MAQEMGQSINNKGYFICDIFCVSKKGEKRIKESCKSLTVFLIKSNSVIWMESRIPDHNYMNEICLFWEILMKQKSTLYYIYTSSSVPD